MIRAHLFLMIIVAATVSCAAATSLAAKSPAAKSPEGNADPFAGIGVYDRADWSQAVTDCDRLAGHPNDPGRVAARGLEQDEIDLPAAIEACRAAVEADPDNPRLNYQLGRVYGYSGRHAEGDVHRDRALKAGYPQSLFVYGYIRLDNWDGRGADACYGGELIRRSAAAGRFAGLVGFPHYYLQGRFAACKEYPQLDVAEMKSFLERAGREADGYYQRILVESLQARLGE